jgi:hypothetical protein
MRSFFVAAVLFLLLAIPLRAQEPPAQSKFFPEVSEEQLRAINQSRAAAQRELYADRDLYAFPDIAIPLSDPLSFIAIVQVTAVKVAEPPNVPFPFVDLHVEQLLRGSIDQTELQAEPRWTPPPLGRVRTFVSSGPLPTAFDFTEPKIGNRFLVGFLPTFMPADVARKRVYITGAINLYDPDQVRLVPEVHRFLAIEASAGDSNTAPFLSALNDSLPWIRDLAAQRLVRSAACVADSACQSAYFAEAQKFLRSKKPADRWEALQWLERPGFTLDGSPNLSDPRIRELLVAAQSDPNFFIGDEAFRKTELLDFSHDATPGDCITVVPQLRRSFRWKTGEADIAHMPGTTICTSTPPPSDNQ